MIALLALAPEMRRSRKWLQSMLWSDRGESQGADSLRQCLSEIRRTLDQSRKCLISKDGFVGFDQDYVRLDAGDPASTETLITEPYVDLLEGLDVRDAEFENWLRDRRQSYCQQGSGSSASCDATGKEEAERRQSRSKLFVVDGQSDGNVLTSIEADGFADIVARTASEFGTIDIIDLRARENNGGAIDKNSSDSSSVQLKVDAAQRANKTVVRLMASKTDNCQRVAAETLELSQPISDVVDDVEVLGKAVRVADSVIGAIYAEHASGKPQHAAASLCQEGFHRQFRVGREHYEAADRLFAKAYELDAKGTYLAWRAFVRTFLIAERKCTNRSDARLEAMELIRRAIELEPQNSLVSSLASHVYSIAMRSYVTSFEFAEQSIRLNPANALGWAFLGAAKCHLGDSQRGFEDTMRARQISGNCPFRFILDGHACIAAVVAGRYSEAIRVGEAGHNRAPDFAVPVRHLAVLYHFIGDQAAADRMAEKMSRLEPDFSYAKMRDESYPAAGLRRTPLLDSVPRSWL